MAGEEINKEALDSLLESEGASLERDQEEADFDAAFGGENNEASTPAANVKEKEDELDQDTSKDTEPNPADAEDKERSTDAAGSGKDQAADVDPLRALEQRITARVRNIEGKFGELNRGWNQIQQEVKGIANRRGVDTPSAKQLEAAKQDSKLLAELKEEYKEWAMLSEAVAEEKAAQTEERILQKIPKMEGYVSKEEMQQAISSAIWRDRQEQIVDTKYPQWQNMITPEFQGWLKGQDENTRALAESDLASDTIALLDLYTSSKRPADAGKKEKQQQRLKSAVAPTHGRATPRPAASTEEDDFVTAFNT